MASTNPFLWWLPQGGGAAAASGKAPPLPDVHAKPGHLIRRAQQIAVAIFLEECAAEDLTPVQYAVLIAIRDNPGIDATRVSGLIAFDRTTISGVMERLEAKGFVQRQTNAADKRAKVVDITTEGKKLLRTVEPKVERAQQRILAPLSTEEQQALMSLLSKLVDLNNEASRAPKKVADGSAD